MDNNFDPDAYLSEKSSSGDRKSTRLNSSHTVTSYAVFCLKKKKCRIHAILVPENYTTTTSTAVRRNSTTATPALRRSHTASLRRHCLTMELPTASPKGALH